MVDLGITGTIIIKINSSTPVNWDRIGMNVQVCCMYSAKYSDNRVSEKFVKNI